ncbi:PIN domain-containing protein (plasmid) [Streptomyces sp. NBC_00464]|uniref:PIN domain-containing protein n=1 Tax=Streptomyces sp. NBC_00464 TaxID=2975751 RepID=UPI002E175F52
MIILDSCVIRGMSLDGSEAAVLRAIRRTKAEQIGAPWMAVEELAAQKALAYGEAHEAATLALSRLQGKSHRTEPKLDSPDPEGVRKLWRDKYRGILEVLPTSEAALREGMFREANVLPPAKRKGEGERAPKIGARDAAIWLTAIEYARDHPDENVYFVSSNHKDFTKGGGVYPSPMDADVEDLGDRFKHLTNLGDVLALVAPTVDIEEGDVRALLERNAVTIQEMAADMWGNVNAGLAFDVMTSAGERAEATGWLKYKDGPHARLVDVGPFQAYRLGEEEYVVASSRWEISGLALVGGHFTMAACHWEGPFLAPISNKTGRCLEIERLGRGVRTAATVNVRDVEWTMQVSPSTAALARAREIGLDRGGKATKLEMFMAFLHSMSNPDPSLQNVPEYLRVNEGDLLSTLQRAAKEQPLSDDDAYREEEEDL